jgi:hypothetical protein
MVKGAMLIGPFSYLSPCILQYASFQSATSLADMFGQIAEWFGGIA